MFFSTNGCINLNPKGTQLDYFGLIVVSDTNFFQTYLKSYGKIATANFIDIRCFCEDSNNMYSLISSK